MSLQVEKLRELGTKLWNRFYKTNDHSGLVSFLTDMSQRDISGAKHAIFALEWVEYGAVQLTTTHKYASALAATDVSIDAWGNEDLHMPAPALIVSVPEGVIRSGICDVRVIAFMMSDEEVLLGLEDSNRVGPFFSSANTDDFFTEQFNCYEDWPVKEGWNSDFTSKAMLLSRRIVLGLLFALQFTDNFKERKTGLNRVGELRDSPPPHRVFEIGRPISVDCRSAIKEWLKEGGDPRGPAAFQSIVRGHYKRQVVGASRLGRKVIWIEPYWRGPGEAPILVRPLKIEGKAVE